MKKVFLIVFVITISACAAGRIGIRQLQGAWWSETGHPTANFAIHENQVWLDIDSQYHPCKIERDILIFDLSKGLGLGLVKNRIVSLKGDKLVLENLETRQRWAITRAKQPR